MARRVRRSLNQGAEDEMVALLRHLVAIELWRGGVSQTEIGKRLRVAKVTVNKYLKDVKRTNSD